MFSQEVRAHNATALGTSLVARYRAHPVPVRVLAYRCVHSTAPAYVADSLQLTADAPARRCLHSTDMMTVSAVDAMLYHQGPDISSGGSSSLEQSAACNESRQLTAAVSARDKSAPRFWTDS